jgi:hypothetical protein
MQRSSKFLPEIITLVSFANIGIDKVFNVGVRYVCMYKGGPKTGPSTATFNDLLGEMSFI